MERSFWAYVKHNLSDLIESNVEKYARKYIKSRKWGKWRANNIDDIELWDTEIKSVRVENDERWKIRFDIKVEMSRQVRHDILSFRTHKLFHLMQSAYEDKVCGKVTKNICVSFIEKYSAEQNHLRRGRRTRGEKERRMSYSRSYAYFMPSF